MDKDEKQESPFCGETDTVRLFKAKKTTACIQALGFAVTKGQVYAIPENQAGRLIFEPTGGTVSGGPVSPQSEAKTKKGPKGKTPKPDTKGG